ncbi:MAG: uroporphyrinogen-III C-methyltransferase [Rickettsiales bacterium]|nr:uroporphyrinogen-III C-methyltransferase [Rickettsiales bacterium]
MSKPYVYIVGAGPGDPELMTVKARRLIEEVAEIVVYDRLIPDEIINLIPEHVTKIYAGKSCRKHFMTQEEINQCLVESAQTGAQVVRLKGGDPFIFGRGREEVDALIEASIDFEVVPGVNAADGCAAYSNIPLTHRGLATGVRFITGHKQKGQILELDWQGLADPHTTLVIFMGLANLERITTNLMSHGLPADTPAATIQKGTTTEQQTHYTTLGKLVETAEIHQIKPPTIIIIGKVVALGEAYHTN